MERFSNMTVVWNDISHHVVKYLDKLELLIQINLFHRKSQNSFAVVQVFPRTDEPHKLLSYETERPFGVHRHILFVYILTYCFNRMWFTDGSRNARN